MSIPETLKQPIVLGKYTLTAVLGKGGFDTVYQATDTQLEREVAAKMLHVALTTSAILPTACGPRPKRWRAFITPTS